MTRHFSPNTGVGSEIGRLRRVLVQGPDPILRYLSPANRHLFQYAESPWPEQAEAEHTLFRRLMADREVEVLTVQDLLAEVLKIPDARRFLLETKITRARVGTKLHEFLVDRLDGMASDDLASVCLCGLTAADVLDLGGDGLMLARLEPTAFVIPPLPNLIYTRDNSFWVGSRVALSQMKLQYRRFEHIELEAIYRFHPGFGQPAFAFQPCATVDAQLSTIEGGDVMPLTPDTLLVGMGDRTEPQAVEELAGRLFDTGTVREVIAVSYPRSETFMHLDTVMTVVDRDAILHAPELSSKLDGWRLTCRQGGRVVHEPLEDPLTSVGEALGAERLRRIPVGGDTIRAAREHAALATNVLALEPGVVLAYDRNTATNRNLQEAGIEVLPVPSGELARCGGGPRCMSCPILRDPF